MDNNISRILYEVQNNLQWIATQTYNYSFYDFTQSQDTPYNLGLAFLANYERPADPNQPIRGTQAEYWFNYLSDIPIKKKNYWKWKNFRKINIKY